MTGAPPAQLAGRTFAAGLTPGQLERLASIAAAAEVPAGQRLFDEGGQAASLWLIRAQATAKLFEISSRALFDLCESDHAAPPPSAAGTP